MNTNTALATRRSFPPSLAELYPLAHDRAVSDTLRVLLTADRDARGRRVLLAQPSEEQRHMLARRLGLLSAHLRPAKRGEIARAVSEMLSGFGSSRANEKEAMTVVAQYCAVLQAMPLWAIRRACGRFSRGEVGPDEIDGKIDRAFAPSTAQLHAVAGKIVHDFRQEEMDIRDTQRGVIEHKLTGEGLKRMQRATSSWLDRSDPAAKAQVEALEDAQRVALEKVAIDAQEATHRAIMREYERLGLPPRYGGDGLPISPSLLKALGKLPGQETESTGDDEADE